MDPFLTPFALDVLVEVNPVGTTADPAEPAPIPALPSTGFDTVLLLAVALLLAAIGATALHHLTGKSP